jgi:type IV pilus assembly protein PilE
MKTSRRAKLAVSGFTLIEVMITVAVVAILAAVALPSYFDYITRSRLVEARANLADMRTRMEQFFLDNRTYPATCVAATATPTATQIRLPGNAKFFSYACSNLGAATYTITATDTFSPGGQHFTYTVNEQNVRNTTAVPSGWNTPAAPCWVTRKNGDC